MAKIPIPIIIRPAIRRRTGTASRCLSSGFLLNISKGSYIFLSINIHNPIARHPNPKIWFTNDNS